MSRRPDLVTLVAGVQVASLGILLVLDQADVLHLGFGWLAPALAVTVGVILLVSGLVRDGR